MRTPPDFSHERALHAAGVARVAGVDEAGRGPLAGPVVAAAVILDPRAIPEGLADSKVLGWARRKGLAALIEATSAVGVGIADVEEIEALNILRAAHLAMLRAAGALPGADHLLIDGTTIPRDCPLPATAIVKGDARVLSIAAASIVAKVRRDRIMATLAQRYPGYGWEKNAGYPTKSHIRALRDLGVTPHHRRTFRPVREML
ncbi:MAG: ribonuclease HII [Shimia sp.]